MAWNVQNAFKLRNLVLSDKQQSAWGTAIGDAQLVRRMEFDPQAYVNLGRSYRSDADKTGKGHPYPTHRVATDQDTNLDLTLDVDDYIGAWACAFLMGNLVTTGSGPYVHTIKFQQTSGSALATTLYAEDTSALKALFLDFGINTAEFSGSGRGPVQLRLGMIGGGKRTAHTISSLPNLPTFKELLASDTVVSIGPPGSPAAIDVDRILQWTVTLTQDISSFKGPGSGIFGTQLKINKPTVKLALTIAAKETDDLVSDFLTDVEHEVVIDTNSDASGHTCRLKFDFPSVYWSQAQPSTDNTNEVAIQIASDENSILKKTGQEVLIVTAENSQASYLGVAS